MFKKRISDWMWTDLSVFYLLMMGLMMVMYIPVLIILYWEKIVETVRGVVYLIGKRIKK